MDYLITDFGACMCDRPQTREIQAAIDACFRNGGGRVVIPAGIFLTGGLRLRSNVELHLQSGAILSGSRNPEDYNSYYEDTLEPIRYSKEPPEGIGASAWPCTRWCNAMIRAIDAKNIAITGENGSYINGNNCFDAIGEEQYRGPHAISMWYCENIRFDGYTVTDSANWAHAIFNSRNIRATNLLVLGGHDGFDVRTCDNVHIEDCRFYTGDDCVAGFDNNDVVVRNCVLDCACSFLRFGGNHVLVENCHGHVHSSYGFRGSLTREKRAASAPTDESCRHSSHTPFLYYCDFRAKIRKTPGDIVIRNCVFENPDSMFMLQFDGAHKWCCNRSLSSVTFENCTITGVREPAWICGDEKEPLDMVLKNVILRPAEGLEDLPVMDAKNFKRIRMENVTLEGFSNPRILSRSEGVIEQIASTPVKVVKG